MDFINNHDLIVASVSAAIAVVIGFILGNKYRKHLGDSFELSITKTWLHKCEEQFKQVGEERQNYYYETMRLKRELEELRAIDERTAQKEAHIKRLDEDIKKEIDIFHKLNQINRDIRRKDEIEQYENEVKAEKEGREAKRAEKKQADDTLDDYRTQSNNIGKDKPKPPKNGS